MATDATRPDYQHPALRKALPDLTLLADLLGGTPAMVAHASAQGYIPQWPDETEKTYAKRIRAAACYEGLARTLDAAVGMLFAQPPVVTFPAQEAVLAAHWDNIDGAGHKGTVALKMFAADALRDGVGLILVDHPSAPAGTVVTAAAEQELGLRPRWAFYPRASILSWRTAIVRGVTVIAQVVLYEPTEREAGLFGVESVDRYRELWLRNGVAGWTIWERVTEAGQGETFRVDSQGRFLDRTGNTRDTLPVSVCHTGRRAGPFVSRPPLMGVAYANLQHWRNKTELEWGSKLAAIEQPVLIGALMRTADGQPGALKMGWEHGIHLDQGGDYKIVGPTGAGLGQLKERVGEAEQEMAALGMSFLSRETRAQETAEAKRLDATAENSTLATAAQAIEDAANLAWEHHAWYLGLAKAEAPTIALNRDFDLRGFTAGDLGAVVTLADSGFPKRELTHAMARLGFLRTTDVEELDDLALQWEAGGDAAAELRRMTAEATQPLPRAA